jgi:Phage capsid family
MPTTLLTTQQLQLPNQILDPWLGKVIYGSAVATLSGATPMRFGPGQTMTFAIGEAEYVGEGADKGLTELKPTVKTVTPFKFHKTVRWTEEVKWADEDTQLGAIEMILAQIQPALSRALDYGVFHGINPTGGAPVAAMTEKLSDTPNAVAAAADGKAYTAVDAADALVLAGGYVPGDIALDPAYAAAFGSLRGGLSEQKLYPDLSYATAPAGRLESHDSSVSSTVGAANVAATDTGILAFVGDFAGIRWGIQRAIGLELIEYGDPDGGGDLKRNNQVAFRAEVVYGWGIQDLAAFAKITGGGTGGASEDFNWTATVTGTGSYVYTVDGVAAPPLTEASTTTEIHDALNQAGTAAGFNVTGTPTSYTIDSGKGSAGGRPVLSVDNTAMVTLAEVPPGKKAPRKRSTKK